MTIEEASPEDRLDLFGRALTLTPRETRLLRLIASGADTRAVAASLIPSEYTVQDHLKSVFAKAGVRSRSALLASALGHRAADGRGAGTQDSGMDQRGGRGE